MTLLESGRGGQWDQTHECGDDGATARFEAGAGDSLELPGVITMEIIEGPAGHSSIARTAEGGAAVFKGPDAGLISRTLLNGESTGEKPGAVATGGAKQRHSA